MESDRIEPCCPVDPQKRAMWGERLQKEKNGLVDVIVERESILEALGNFIRLTILYQLGIRPNCVCELVTKTQATNSAVSYHLSFLTRYSIIRGRNISGRMYYHLTEYGRKIIRWLEAMPLRETPLEPAARIENSV